MIKDLTAQYHKTIFQEGSIKQAIQLIKNGETLKIEEKDTENFETALQQHLHDTNDKTEVTADIEKGFKKYRLKKNKEP